jgi:hypothetical protein
MEPYGFFKDLGFNWEVIENYVHWVRSPTDAIDLVGWSPWKSGPFLYLHSCLGDAIGILIAFVAGNSWLAVKIVEVLQFIVAGAGAYAMYASASRSRRWAALFALAYAVLPATALIIRWNEDFGWILALLPWVLAFGRRATLRFGGRATPLVGLLAAVSGYLIALQFLVFVSLPVYAITIGCLRDQLGKTVGVRSAWITAGILVCVGSGAFFVLPSFIQPMLSDSAQRSESLASGGFLSQFSMNWLALLTLVQREWVASPIPDFDVSKSLPILIAPSALLWIAAVAHLVRTKVRIATWSDPISISIVAACTILSLGSTVPGGAVLWNALYRIPHFDGIRTADRFFAIVPLMVLFWAALFCERIAAASRTRLRVLGYTWLLICAQMILFDRFEHVLALDASKGMREPNLDAVRATVEADGLPVASFALANEAAHEDAPMYGRPERLSWSAADLGSRFIENGNGARGALGRIGVGDVITAPSWVYDWPGLPNATNIYRALPGVRAAFDEGDVVVSRIPHRPDVESTSIVCVHGGPGAFDLLDGDAALRPYAFAEEDARCSTAGYVDYDHADDWRAEHPLDAWSARTLALDGQPLLDVDYPVLYNRTLLNIPWYRNAVEGERPVFDPAGSIRLLHATRATLPGRHSWPAGSRLYARIDAHDPGIMTISAGDTPLGGVRLRPGVGFRWYAIPIVRGLPARIPVSVGFAREATVDDPRTWPGIVLDGIAVLPAREIDAATKPATFVAASIGHFDATDLPYPSETELIDNPGSPIVSVSGAKLSRSFGAPAYLTTAGLSRLHFRWDRPSGVYAIGASGVLDAASTLGLTTGRAACCSTYRRGVPGAATDVYTHSRLERGTSVTVQLASSAFDPARANRITSVRYVPYSALRVASADIFEPTPTLDFTKPLEALAHVTSSNGVTFSSDGALGSAGAALRADFRPVGAEGSVRVTLATSMAGEENSGMARLSCGDRHADAALFESTDLVVGFAAHGPCSITVLWGRQPTILKKMTFEIEGDVRRPSATARLWIPRGRFEIHLLNKDGSAASAAAVHIAGCRSDACQFTADGNHDVVFSEPSSENAVLVLIAGRQTPEVASVATVRTNAIRWRVTVSKATDLVLTQLDDGNWRLDGSGYRSNGTPCDIADTCFRNVPAGTFWIEHTWPWQLQYGVALTLVCVIVSLGVLYVPRPRGDTYQTIAPFQLENRAE